MQGAQWHLLATCFNSRCGAVRTPHHVPDNPPSHVTSHRTEPAFTHRTHLIFSHNTTCHAQLAPNRSNSHTLDQSPRQHAPTHHTYHMLPKTYRGNPTPATAPDKIPARLKYRPPVNSTKKQCPPFAEAPRHCLVFPCMAVQVHPASDGAAWVARLHCGHGRIAIAAAAPGARGRGPQAATARMQLTRQRDHVCAERDQDSRDKKIL